MRWDHMQLASEPQDDAVPLPLPLAGQGAVVRTFDTPEFRGVTFYEVRAKSVLNRVPASSPVPFRWTVNPYRGCTHACTYCLSGETRILTADGRTKPIADLRVGDEIYGTRRDGASRRYVRTTVLAHWPTVKAAHRITLRDGTTLVASGDHRFLTRRGWKYVTGARQGSGRRPHLTVGSSLVGTGAFADGPKTSDPEYRRGYLCGVAQAGAAPAGTAGRGGALPGFRPGLGVPAASHRAAIDRTEDYLEGLGVAPAADATSTPAEAADARRVLAELTAHPAEPSDAWRRGLLAGLLDAGADGADVGADVGAVRVTSDDGLRATADALRGLGFRCVVEGSGRRGGVRVVRVLGGPGERLRLLHAVEPAAARVTLDGAAVRSDAPLDVVSVEALGLEVPMYDITTGTGDFVAEGVVSHNCFARKTHEYLELDAGHDFDSRVVVKVNAGEVLRRELGARGWAGEHVAMGTNTDPYQRAEGRYALMRGVLGALVERANPFSILTKGTLVLRDLDLITEAAQVTDVRVNVSVGFVDSTLWRQVEPGTPNPRARLGVCRALVDAGIGCGVLMAPVLPYLTDSDEQLEATVAAVAEAGADAVTPLVLHLRPGAREWFFGWLRGSRPDLVPRYERLYRSAYAPREYTGAITARVARLARAYGIGTRPTGASRLAEPALAAPAATQLTLM